MKFCFELARPAWMIDVGANHEMEWAGNQKPKRKDLANSQ